MARVKLPHAKHLQSVVEWRFDRAHRYWDDCGKLIAAVESEFPSLTCQGLQPDGFKFDGGTKAITSASFYWDKAVVSQVGAGDAHLGEAAARFWTLIEAGLGVLSPKWVGHRTWLCFELPSPKDAAHFLESFPLWNFGLTSAGDLGVPQAGGSVLRTLIEPNGRKLRIETNAGTMQIGTVKHHGLIVDADIMTEPPAAIPEDFAAYIEANLRFLRENLEPSFRNR